MGTPALTAPMPLTGQGRPRARPHLPPGASTIDARAWAATQAPRQWRLVSWRNGTHPAWRARFCAVRVTPAHDWRERRRAPAVWLLCERERANGDRVRDYWVDLPPSASLRALVSLAHQRWAIEQPYQELTDDIGLDHFEGRTLPGWQRQVALRSGTSRHRVRSAVLCPGRRGVIQRIQSPTIPVRFMRECRHRLFFQLASVA